MPVVIFLVVAVVFHVLLRHTRYGKYTYAIGANALAARVSGVRVERHLIVVYTIAGLLAGLGGVVTSARAASGQAGMGMSYELDAIAAAVIGGTSLSGGIGRIAGTVIGTIILGIMTSGFTFIGLDAYIQDIVKGRRHRVGGGGRSVSSSGRKAEGGKMLRVASRRFAGMAMALLFVSSAMPGCGRSAAPARPVIGVSMAHFDDNFLTILRTAMVEHAANFPGIDLRFVRRARDVGRQLSQIQNFAAQDAAAIIVNAADTSATPGMTKIAREAGVPLVYVNRRPAEETLPRVSCSSGPKTFRQARWRWKSSRG